MLIHSDPNNMNSIVYHLIIVGYSMKTWHWYFPWATALHLYNMTSRGGKLQQLHCYHPFSDSLDIYLAKNHYENYSPKMVPIAKILGPGSWTIMIYKSLLVRVMTWCYRNTSLPKTLLTKFYDKIWGHQEPVDPISRGNYDMSYVPGVAWIKKFHDFGFNSLWPGRF